MFGFSDHGSASSLVGNGGGSFFDTVTDVVTTVYHDVVDVGKAIVTTPGHIVDKVLNRGADVVRAVSDNVEKGIEHLGNNIEGLGSSFSWPIAMALGAVGIFYVMKK